MKYDIDLLINTSKLIAYNKMTLRQAGKINNYSKSSLHKHIYERLYYIDKKLFLKVKEVLDFHNEIKHLRGGESTKIKYLYKK